MDCRRCNDDLSAYLDGELADSARDDLERHLGECEPCKEEYLDLKRSSELVESKLPVLEPAPEIWNGLRTRIISMPTASDSPGGFFSFITMNRWITAAATLAATVALALALWGYVQYQNSRQELERYMSEYIQARDMQERMLQIQDAGAGGVDNAGYARFPENPFAVTKPASFTNPFRSEGK